MRRFSLTPPREKGAHKRWSREDANGSPKKFELHEPVVVYRCEPPLSPASPKAEKKQALRVQDTHRPLNELVKELEMAEHAYSEEYNRREELLRMRAKGEEELQELKGRIERLRMKKVEYLKKKDMLK